MRRLLPLVLCAALLGLALPATAGAKTPSLKSLAKTVTALQKKVNAQSKTIAKLSARLKADETALAAKHSLLTGSGAPAAASGSVGDMYLDTMARQLYGPKTSSGWGSPTSLVGPKGGTGATWYTGSGAPAAGTGVNNDLYLRTDTGAVYKKSSGTWSSIANITGPDPAADPDYAGLFAVAPYVTVQGTVNGVHGPNVVLQGCNLQVKSTTSETDTSGTGNVIVGWNYNPYSLPSPFRTGSNNLVVGSENNFTTCGCFVAGYQNTTSGAFSSVSGGYANTANNSYASVSGGAHNTASGTYSSISGGGHWYNNSWYGLTESTTYGWRAGCYNLTTSSAPKYSAP